MSDTDRHGVPHGPTPTCWVSPGRMSQGRRKHDHATDDDRARRRLRRTLLRRGRAAAQTCRPTARRPGRHRNRRRLRGLRESRAGIARSNRRAGRSRAAAPTGRLLRAHHADRPRHLRPARFTASPPTVALPGLAAPIATVARASPRLAAPPRIAPHRTVTRTRKRTRLHNQNAHRRRPLACRPGTPARRPAPLFHPTSTHREPCRNETHPKR